MSNSEFIFSQPGSYTFLTGAAPEEFIQKNTEHTGVITAPTDFFVTKHVLTRQDAGNITVTDFNFADMLVKFSLSEGWIEYIENNSTTEKGAVIKGKIYTFPGLKELGINTQKTYTSQTLADKLKFSRSLFQSSDECMNMVTKLKKFTATINTEIDNIDDKQGNKKIAFAQKISHELDLTFTLSCPIVSGTGDKKTFKVEIMFDLRDKAIEFWLESVELKEISDSFLESEITKLLEPFKIQGVPIIQIL